MIEIVRKRHDIRFIVASGNFTSANLLLSSIPHRRPPAPTMSPRSSAPPIAHRSVAFGEVA